jgi:hypothetical protein
MSEDHQERLKECCADIEAWKASRSDFTLDKLAEILPLCPDKIAELMRRLGCSESEAKRELIKAPTPHK